MEFKDLILKDAIRTALSQNRIIEIQKGVIAALIGAVVFLLFREV